MKLSIECRSCRTNIEFAEKDVTKKKVVKEEKDNEGRIIKGVGFMPMDRFDKFLDQKLYTQREYYFKKCWDRFKVTYEEKTLKCPMCENKVLVSIKAKKRQILEPYEDKEFTNTWGEVWMPEEEKKEEPVQTKKKKKKWWELF